MFCEKLWEEFVIVQNVNHGADAEKLHRLVDKFLVSTDNQDAKPDFVLQSVIDAAEARNAVVLCAQDVAGRPSGYIVARIICNYGTLIVFVEQIYSERANVGKELFHRICEWGRSNGIGKVVGTTFHRGRAVSRVFGTEIRGYYLVKQLS